MSFPLADWIDAHAGAKHNLAQSGMVGSLASTPRALNRPVRSGDADELRRALADRHGVAARRLFLTHGASEGNALAALFLARDAARRRGRAPRVHVPVPEYPPFRDLATWAGARLVGPEAEVDLTLMSRPSNPEGRLGPVEEVAVRTRRHRAVLVDETFREFTSARSLQREGLDGLWTTGTFTKAFGADSVRVGWVIVPDEQREAFSTFHGLALDGVPPASVGLALGLLRDSEKILRETRRIFDANRETLARAVPALQDLAAPVAFDRGDHGGLDGDRLARAALRRGVLVCPGRYFSDPSGVRLTLTRRSFPADLAAYLAVRSGFA